MNRRFLVHGLPKSAGEPEVRAFLSLLGPVRSLHLSHSRSLKRPADWEVEMRTDEGSEGLLLLDGEGYRATPGWKNAG